MLEPVEILAPDTWEQALAAKAEHPDALAIAGGTDVMVALNFDRARPAAMLDLTRVPELRDWGADNGQLRIGAGVTYTRLIDELGDRLPGLAIALRSARRRSATAARRQPATVCRRATAAAARVSDAESSWRAPGTRRMPFAGSPAPSATRRATTSSSPSTRPRPPGRSSSPRFCATRGHRRVLALCDAPSPRGSRAQVGRADAVRARAGRSPPACCGRACGKGAGRSPTWRAGASVRSWPRPPPIDDVRAGAYRRHAPGCWRRTLSWAWEEQRCACADRQRRGPRVDGVWAREALSALRDHPDPRAPRTPASRASAARARSTSTASSCACLVPPGSRGPRGRHGGGRRGRGAHAVQQASWGRACAVRVLHAGPIVASRPVGPQRVPTDPRSVRRWPATCCRATKILDAVRLAGSAEDGGRAAIATVDAPGPKDATVTVIEGDRIVGSGRPPEGEANRIDGRGCLATPGSSLPPPPLPVGHARARPAGDAPSGSSSSIRSGRTSAGVEWAAAAPPAALARSGCSTSTDHHYALRRRRQSRGRDRGGAPRRALPSIRARWTSGARRRPPARQVVGDATRSRRERGGHRPFPTAPGARACLAPCLLPGTPS
jgi:hypothetical protein